MLPLCDRLWKCYRHIGAYNEGVRSGEWNFVSIKKRQGSLKNLETLQGGPSPGSCTVQETGHLFGAKEKWGCNAPPSEVRQYFVLFWFLDPRCDLSPAPPPGWGRLSKLCSRPPSLFLILLELPVLRLGCCWMGGHRDPTTTKEPKLHQLICFF